jgi:hypothetical protein
VRQPQRPPVTGVGDLLDPGDGPGREERQQPRGVQRGPERQPQHQRPGRDRRRAPAPPGLVAQRRRCDAVDLAHGVVELAHAGEPGRERHVGHPERRRLDQQPRRVRPVRPGERQRPRPEFRGEHPVELALRITQSSGEPADAVALDDAVGDEPHRPGGEVGAQVPVRRAGHGVGQAAPAGPVAALLRGPRGGQELDVRPLRGDGRAGRPAVDAGGAHGGDEVPVEARVAGGDGAVAAFLVE